MPDSFGTSQDHTQTAVFGGGCFWCTEGVFKMLRGVMSVMPGYAGGTGTPGSVGNRAPTYEEVSRGDTGYAEVIQIVFDPAQISFEDLLTVFFASHDPTTINRQGADTGPQYRSIILYTDEPQKVIAEKFIDELNSSSATGTPIVTEVVPLDTFHPAEEYHVDYYARNESAPYCQIVINPKLEKVQKQFANLLKEKSTS